MTGGQPNGPEKQGLSWAFQLLPYLEQDAVYNLTTQAQVEKIAVPTYSCPSRRRGARQSDRVLMDYASATPGDGQSWAVEDHYWHGDIWRIPHNKQYNGVIARVNSLWTEHKKIVATHQQAFLRGCFFQNGEHKSFCRIRVGGAL